MRYLKRSTLITVSFSLVLMRVERGEGAPIQDEKFVLKGPSYPLTVLPIIDSLQIEKAFTNKNYMKFLMKCVFFEGPCDMVGKWLKHSFVRHLWTARTLAALFGNCLNCTPFQQENMENWLLALIRHNRDLFRMAMIKVCVDMNLPVPEAERNRIIPFLKRRHR